MLLGARQRRRLAAASPTVRTTADVAEPVRYGALEIVGIAWPEHPPLLADGQVVVLNPGRTGGALEFAQTLTRFACAADIVLGEVQTFVYAAESRGPAAVEILNEKFLVRAAAVEPMPRELDEPDHQIAVRQNHQDELRVCSNRGDPQGNQQENGIFPPRREVDVLERAEERHLHEIVGLGAKIIESTDPSLQGTSGTIIFETKNTISIRTGSSVKHVAKKAAKKIEIKTDSGVCFISGSSMIGRPEDRITRLNN